MEIVGVGIDIIELDRLRNADALDRLLEFLFLPEEIKKIPKGASKIQHIGSRIAAKEAVIKAFPGDLHYHDLAIEKKGKGIAVRFVRKKDQHYRVFITVAHEFN